MSKQFYALMLTSPKLASPIVIQTYNYFPNHDEIKRVGMPHVNKNRDWSLLVHFDEQPQLHIVPFTLPILERVEEPIPLLPAPPKVPYLA